MKHGVERAFHLPNADGTAIPDPHDAQVEPCCDARAPMRRFDVIREISDAMPARGQGTTRPTASMRTAGS